MTIAAILVAAGSGSRFGADTPKQFLPLAGKPVIRHAAEALAARGRSAATGRRGGADRGRPGAASAHLPVVPGGATRQDSVRAGLEALAPHAPDIVLVHDAARPLHPARHHSCPAGGAGARPGRHPRGPGRRHAEARRATGVITETVPRAGLFRAQTPQAFRFAALLAAHRAPATDGATDDASLLEAAGQTVAAGPRRRGQHQADLSRGPARGWSVRWADPPAPADRHRLRRARLRRRAPPGAVRRHRAARSAAWPATPTPMSASTRCATRSTARWPRAISAGTSRRARPPGRTPTARASCVHAAGRIAVRGGRLANVDVTLICERPKIAPYAAAMTHAPRRAAGGRSVPRLGKGHHDREAGLHRARRGDRRAGGGDGAAAG